MKAHPTSRLIGMAVVSGITGVASLLALIAVNGGGAVSLGPLALTPIAAGYDRWAQARLSEAAVPPPAIRRQARIASEQAITQFPYDTAAWLRLAYVDTLDHGELTATGASALQRSYDLIAADPDFGLWRVAFALEHSEALPRPLRAAVREEVDAIWRGDGDHRKLLNLRKQLRNPAGRLSLILWINRLQANSAK